MAQTSTILRDDPFKDIRAGSQRHAPYDTLEDIERDDYQDKILEIHQKYAPEDSVTIEEDFVPGEPSDQKVQQWKNIILNTVSRDAEYQRMVLDERASPGTHNFSTLRIRPEFLIGIYLPGFYFHFSTFQEGYETCIQPRILSFNFLDEARFQIDFFILEIEAQRFGSLDQGEDGQRRPPAYSTKSCISNLFLLCQEEKALNYSRIITHDYLRELGPMLDGMPNAKKLSELCRAKASNQDEGSMLDRFGWQVLNALPPWARFTADPKPITKSTTFQADVKTAASNAEVTDGVRDEYEAAESSTINVDAKLKVDELSKRVEDHLSTAAITCFYPIYTAPSNGRFFFIKHPAHSLSQFDSQGGESIRTTQQGATLRRTTGFKRARMISREMAVDSGVVTAAPSADDVLGESMGYLSDISNSSYFHQQGFKSLYAVLANMVERPKTAQKAKLGATDLGGFSDLLLRDNFWHLRNLKEAIKVLLVEAMAREKWAQDRIKSELDQAEKDFTILIAMVGAGADDPLPWILAVEHSVRQMWVKITATMTKASLRPTNQLHLLFTEFVLFVNASVVNAYIIRCPLRVGARADEIIDDWYKQLYEYEPNCANTDCLRLLPHPSRVTSKWVRGAFSVGTRETRNGRKAVRAFISTNRENGYDCLFYVLRFFKPSPETIVFIF